MTHWTPRTRRRFVCAILAFPALLALSSAIGAGQAHPKSAGPHAKAAPVSAAAKAKPAPLSAAAKAKPVPVSAAAPAKAAAVGMHLVTERRGETRDAQGQTQETWTLLAPGTSVQTGDLLRCTVQIASHSARPIANFVLTQPVPSGLAYAANSARVRGTGGVQITYRAQGSDAFQAVPTINVPQPDGSVKAVPAPPSAFRAVRWTWTQPLQPGQSAEAVFGEEVR